MIEKRMKYQRILTVGLLVLTMLALFAMPSEVKAQTGDDPGDKFVLGGRYRLEDGESINGNLVVMGGTAILEQGSSVNGQVVLVGGTLEAGGTINGDVNAIGGTITILDEAVVNGDLNVTSVSLTASPLAVITGKVNENVFNLDDVQFDSIPETNVDVVPQTPARTLADFIIKLLWAGIRILAMSIFAAVVVLLAPKPTDRVARTIIGQPLVSSGFGLLTLLVAPVILLLLTITLILIPVAVIALLVLGIGILFGWIALGYEIGLRLEKALKLNWAPAVNAGIGTFVLTSVASLAGIIPCIGWVIPFIISVVSIGGVLISRFGTTIYTTGNDASLRTGTSQVHPQDQYDVIVDEPPADETRPETDDRSEEI